MGPTRRSVTLGWKSLPLTNTLAYWANLEVLKEMNCCKYNSCNSIHTS